MAGCRFIALRPLRTKAGLVKAGDPVPEAEHWPVHIMLSEIAAGHVKDLHQVYKVPPHLSKQKREERTLADMAARGIVVEPHPDEPGHLTVTRTEAADEQAKTPDEPAQGDVVTTDGGEVLEIGEKIGEDTFTATEVKETEPEKKKRKGGRKPKAKPETETPAEGAEKPFDGDSDAD